ncbi:acyl-CoA dehydrogenase family protein [Desulfotomaculum copahuensis]|uniref:Acyl-CoA dehydrogenase n=1 Tax=Desulfotomaculum copahuensis TaxID=1838280 RepID=A0A1B7LHN9_9FIRM|nr:acyl-CoA dehydrogenase family protein [Desulfotomaculum copahuensis]OAT85816.1 acyl-CoA dehydrogenase [Desulfotomaculum copahuensis]
MYELSEEQEMLRQMVHRLAEQKVAPRAAAIDEEDAFPWDLKELFAGQELLGAGVPEAYGGTGAGLPAVCVVVEEIARVSAAASLIVAAQELGLMPILLAGSEEQKRKYLPGLAAGELISAFALTEPNAGSDAGSVRTGARREGSKYVLNGQKCFITNGGLADVYTVFASTDPARGIKGLSAFIVEKDAPGFAAGKKEKKMGIRGSQTAELIFEDCEVPAENLLGKEGDGFKIAMMTLDHTRPVIGAQAVGIACGALEYALNYARERVQFGRPIAGFQGIQFMLADMGTRVEAARQLVYKAACFIEEAGVKGAPPAEISRYSSMCKLFASDVAMQVTVDAVQILGGYGYMREYPLERMMRDAKITQIYEGTNQIQRLVVARSMLDKR